MALRRFLVISVVAAASSLGYIRDTRAGDLTVFVGEPRPGDNWGRVYGAAVTANLVPVLSFEGDASRVSGSSLDTAMTAFTASAVVSPPRLITPYAGVGRVFRQTIAGGISDTGGLTALFGGIKSRREHPRVKADIAS